MPDLHISLFGPFEIRLDGEVLARLDSAKVRALLAYLAAEAGWPQPRGILSGLLWPGYPQASANQSLRQALYSLRKGWGIRIGWMRTGRRLPWCRGRGVGLMRWSWRGRWLAPAPR